MTRKKITATDAIAALMLIFGLIALKDMRLVNATINIVLAIGLFKRIYEYKYFTILLSQIASGVLLVLLVFIIIYSNRISSGIELNDSYDYFFFELMRQFGTLTIVEVIENIVINCVVIFVLTRSSVKNEFLGLNINNKHRFSW